MNDNGNLYNTLIKIGICHHYCCKREYFTFYNVPEKNITAELNALLQEYTNKQIDIMDDNPFYNLIKNYFYCGCNFGHKIYDNCKYQLYSQDCKI